jgi:hypothetical protein
MSVASFSILLIVQVLWDCSRRGSGDFGTVVFNDVAHTATLTRLKTGLFAHGSILRSVHQ